MTKEHATSSEIGIATSNVKEFQKNPIMLPVSDYLKGSVIFEKEDSRETENLKKAKENLDEFKKTGIYDDSRIAISYEQVVGIYERIAWIYKKNVSLANSQIAELKKVVERLYVTKEESNNNIEILKEELKILENKLQEKSELAKSQNLTNKIPENIPTEKVQETKEQVEDENSKEEKDEN